MLTVTTRGAGITETPVAGTGSPLPTGAAMGTGFDPDWGGEGEKTGPGFADNTVGGPGGESLGEL
ncbi:MAG: hypothetical protein ACXWO3_18990, partial [Isosphaeraceae bacterium]